MGVAQPSGTVTLVFTDIEGSTRLLAELGDTDYRFALEEHRRAVRDAFGRYGGYEVDTQGDSFFYAFASARDAATAAEQAIEALSGGPIRMRVGVHTGEPRLDGPNYVGIDVHTAARIMAAGHGGQVLLSQSTRDLLDTSAVVTDLGDHRLKDLSRPQRLFQLGTGTFAPLKTLHHTNLPVPGTAFIGRSREVEEVASLLNDGTRLLTLTGPGGSGKTRLALQAVAAMADAFPDGVWWVPLASLRDPGLVLSSVGLALGVPEQVGRSLEDTLVDVLSAGRTLLLLDNLEHLLPAGAAAIAALCSAGGATVVVTSRERLQLTAERVFAVSPLATAEAVELFLARGATLDVELGDVGAVEELCARLDNLPLAVELAAARTGVLRPSEILSRLGSRLDRLRGARDADPRQQTLRATIAWSHDLLDPAERKLFARLAVFAGGATLDAIEAVCEGDLDVLASLFDKSLVRRTGDRFWMLETIREFAAERLADDPDAEDLNDRHAYHYLMLVEASDRDLEGSGQAAALERLETERDNLRAAFEWLLDRDPQSALRLVAAQWSFWWMRSHLREGRELLATAIERCPSEPSEARASALTGAALLAFEVGDYRDAIDLAEKGLACARAANSIRVESIALIQLSAVDELGRPERIGLIEEAIDLARATGNAWLVGVATANYGSLMIRLEETRKAVELTEEAYRICSGAGDIVFSAGALGNLGWIALVAGDTIEARTRINEALGLSRRIDATRGVCSATVNLGWVELLDGDLDRARSCFEEGAASARRLGMRSLGAEALWGFAQAAAAQGDARGAARLAGAASVLGETAGFDPAAVITFARHLDDVRETLEDDEWNKAWAEGRALDLDAALRLALADGERNGP